MQFVFGSIVTCVVTLVHHGLLPPLHFKLHVCLDRILEIVTKFMILGVLIGLDKIITHYHIQMQLEIHFPVLIVCHRGADRQTDHFSYVLNIGRECQIIQVVWGGDMMLRN